VRFGIRHVWLAKQEPNRSVISALGGQDIRLYKKAAGRLPERFFHFAAMVPCRLCQNLRLSMYLGTLNSPLGVSYGG
jgi:hypothetical protein